MCTTRHVLQLRKPLSSADIANTLEKIGDADKLDLLEDVSDYFMKL